MAEETKLQACGLDGVCHCLPLYILASKLGPCHMACGVWALSASECCLCVSGGGDCKETLRQLGPAFREGNPLSHKTDDSEKGLLCD